MLTLLFVPCLGWQSSLPCRYESKIVNMPCNGEGLVCMHGMPDPKNSYTLRHSAFLGIQLDMKNVELVIYYSSPNLCFTGPNMKNRRFNSYAVVVIQWLAKVQLYQDSTVLPHSLSKARTHKSSACTTSFLIISIYFNITANEPTHSWYCMMNGSSVCIASLMIDVLVHFYEDK